MVRSTIAMAATVVVALSASICPAARPAARVGVGSPAATAPAPAPASMPASTTAAAVPKAVLLAIGQQFVPPTAAKTPQEAIELLTQQMEKAVALAEGAQRDYPAASNLPQVQLAMLQAVDFLARLRGDETLRSREKELAGAIIGSPAATPAQRLQADFLRTLLEIRPSPANVSPKARESIEAFVKRHQRATVPQVYVLGVVLASQTRQRELRKQYIMLLKARHLEESQVRAFLKSIGAYTDVGQVFRAVLTRLDGKGLSLPGDLKGKVVIVDFWASWCPACVTSAGPLRRLYDTYRSQGVEIVGISMDKTPKEAAEFVRQNKLPGIQTCSGKADDPTALKYGISRIPTYVVLDRNGRIVNEDARDQLEEMVQKALKATPAR